MSDSRQWFKLSKMLLSKTLATMNRITGKTQLHSNKTEYSFQKCVYHNLPGSLLRKTTLIGFANSNVPKKIQNNLNKEEISELSPYSINIFKQEYDRQIYWSSFCYILCR